LPELASGNKMKR